MTSSIDSFRAEIRENVTGLGRLNHLKIVLVAALLAVAFGISGFGDKSGGAESLQSFSYWVLVFVPFVCVYIDFQYYHGLAKIFVLAHYLKHADLTGDDARLVQDYERFVSRIREEAAPRLFGFESKAQRGSSIFLSLLCAPFCGGLLAYANLIGTIGIPHVIHLAALFILPICGYIGMIYARRQYDVYVRELERARKILPAARTGPQTSASELSSIPRLAADWTAYKAGYVFRARITPVAALQDVVDCLLDKKAEHLAWRALETQSAAVPANDAAFSLQAGPDYATIHVAGTPVLSISWSTLSSGAISTRVIVEKGESALGFGAALAAHSRDDAVVRLANSDTLFHTVPGASYSSFPFALVRCGTECVGVLWNSARVSEARVRTRNGKVSIEMVPLAGGPLPAEVLFMTGSCAQVMDSLAALTGRAAMPPVWGLGLHQSRWSYRDEAAIRKVVAGFRERKIPCDAIHFDIHHMRGQRVFTWDAGRFPNPRHLFEEMQQLGMRAVSIVNPGVKVEPGFDIYDAGLRDSHFFRRRDGSVYEGKVWSGITAFPDFSAQNVRTWWAALCKAETEQGISGLWNDMNEPVLHLGTSDDGITTDIEQRAGPHWAVRNLYANQHAQATFEGMIQASGERPFILSRAATSGIQKFAFIWTGDNATSWQELRRNLNMVINLGLSGVPFSGADVGGFANALYLPPFVAQHVSWLKVVKLRKRRELFCRWIQLGSMMPFFRIHTALFSHAQEPWSFGDAITTIVRKHIRRRYALLPYLYAQAWEAARSGMPLVRPMFVEFPDLPRAEDQFMLGPSLLAAPVFDPGATTRAVRVPRGTWVDFESGRRYVVEESSAVLTLPAPLDDYPLLVRGGTVLPLAPVKRNAVETLAGPLILEMYPDSRLESFAGEAYMDDGLGRLQGSPPRLSIKARQVASGITDLTLHINGVDSQPDRPVLLRLPALVDYGVTARGSELEGQPVDTASEDRSANLIEYRLPPEVLTGRSGTRIEVTAR